MATNLIQRAIVELIARPDPLRRYCEEDAMMTYWWPFAREARWIAQGYLEGIDTLPTARQSFEEGNR